jgi:hypothetical protein
MGNSFCTQCSEKTKDKELVVIPDASPLDLLKTNPEQPSAGRQMHHRPLLLCRVKEREQNPETLEANRQQFSMILKDQLQFNTNATVKAVEMRVGPFPFDDRLVNDSIDKIVVGPQVLENEATYYGHW